MSDRSIQIAGCNRYYLPKVVSLFYLYSIYFHPHESGIFSRSFIFNYLRGKEIKNLEGERDDANIWEEQPESVTLQLDLHAVQFY